MYAYFWCTKWKKQHIDGQIPKTIYQVKCRCCYFRLAVIIFFLLLVSSLGSSIIYCFRCAFFRSLFILLRSTYKKYEKTLTQRNWSSQFRNNHFRWWWFFFILSFIVQHEQQKVWKESQKMRINKTSQNIYIMKREKHFCDTFFCCCANNVFKVAIIAQKLANKQQGKADLCSPIFSFSANSYSIFFISVFISFNCFQVDEEKNLIYSSISGNQHQHHPFYIPFEFYNFLGCVCACLNGKHN